VCPATLDFAESGPHLSIHGGEDIPRLGSSLRDLGTMLHRTPRNRLSPLALTDPTEKGQGRRPGKGTAEAKASGRKVNSKGRKPGWGEGSTGLSDLTGLHSPKSRAVMESSAR
jgi:hypothetical protein